MSEEYSDEFWKKKHRGNMIWHYVVLSLVTLVFLFFLLSSMWIHYTKSYETNIVVDCNDNDGDIIVGQICHEDILCSNNFKFLNPKGCEKFVGSGR